MMNGFGRKRRIGIALVAIVGLLTLAVLLPLTCTAREAAAGGPTELPVEEHYVLLPPVPQHYVDWGWVTGNECGVYTNVCWWALMDAGVGPLMQDWNGSDLTWLSAIGRTLRCESKFERYARGQINHRDRGIAQINSRWWPNISDAQAFDPIWSIYWMAKQFVAGRAELWTCYTKVVRG